MFQNKKLLNKLYTPHKESDSHIIFTHSDKTWVMPADSVSMALNMYQPSTLKGKLLKKLIVIFRNSDYVLRKLNCQKVSLEIDGRIRAYIETAIGRKDFSIAAYMGDTTSRQNNKATLQIYNCAGLICYGKVTEEPQVAETFDWEVKVLKSLENKKINGVPKVLDADTVDGMRVFLQSTNKKVHEKVRLKLDRPQLEFIDRIVKQTKVKSEYCNTDFFTAVQHLKRHKNDYTKSQQVVIEEAIRTVEERLGENDAEYAFAHGDYTPWNVYYAGNELNAFDFEYSSNTMPCYLDAFHYLTQMSLLGFKNDVGKTIRMYKNKRKLLEQYISDTDFVYLCYLVWVVSFYNQRTENKTDMAKGQNEKRIEIMDYAKVFASGSAAD